MDAVSRPDSTMLLLTSVEKLAAQLAEAVEAAEWAAAGELDRSLAQTLGSLNPTLAAADPAERQHAAHRLRAVQTRHRVAMSALATARESLRVELAGVAQGRRGVKSYLESAAG